MSRALDKETAAALLSGDPEAAYHAISDVLTEQPAAGSARLEIELLGREHPPLPDDNRYVLREGNAVAVPKLALVQAFFVARKILQRYRSFPPSTAASLPPATANDDILRATAVILLMDPEQLTAANTRKRVIQARISRPSFDASTVSNELHLIDSLLTSHLHRHTKSPTLWNHRRWLVSVASSLVDESGIRFGVDSVRGIIEVVMAAAIRHPRNYYAWDHARWLVQQTKNQAAAEEESAATKRIILAVRDWSYRHHNDTSGWSFLFFLLTSTSFTGSPVSPPSSSLFRETITQVEQMAMSLRWTGEAVWVFLRTAVAYLGLPQAGTSDDGEYKRFRTAAAALQGHVDTASREHKILQQAQDWCAAYAHGDSQGAG